MRRGEDSWLGQKDSLPTETLNKCCLVEATLVSGRSDFPGLTYKSDPLCSAPIWLGVTGHTARTWKESSEQMCCSPLAPDPITMGDAKLHAPQGEIMFL